MLESSIQVLSGLRRHAFSAIALAGALMLIAAPVTAQTPTPRTIDLSVSPSQLSETDDNTSVTVTARLRGAAITEDITVTPSALGLGTADHVQPNTFSPGAITIAAGSVEGSVMADIDPTNDESVNKDNVITVSGSVTSSHTDFTFTVEGATLTLRNEDRLPVQLGRSVDGPALTLTYNKTMSASVNARHFTVLVGGVANAVSTIALNTEDDKKVVLTLGVAVKAGETVTIAYTKARTSDASAANPLTDSGTNEAPDFSGAVTNVTKIPTVTIRRPAGETGPVDADAFTVEIVFSEDVGEAPAGQTADAFEASDITVTNGEVSGTLTSAVADGKETFSVEIDPDEEGSVTIGVAASVTTSTRSGTPNRAATSLTVRSDQTVPRASITGSPGSGAFPVYINFSEDVTLETSGESVTITGGSATDWEAVGNSKRRFQTTVTPDQPDRTTSPVPPVEIVVTFPVGGAADLAGNTNESAFSRTFTARPAALRLTASGYPTGTTASRPWTRGDFNIDFTVSSSVSATAPFEDSDVTVGGGAIISFGPPVGRRYRATIRPSAVTVTISITAGAVTDGHGNDYPEVATITVHVAVGPTVTIAEGAVQTGGATSRDVTVTFSDAVTGFTASDLRVTNGTASNLRVTTTGTVFVVAITPRADGAATVTVPANAATLATADAGGRRPGNVSSDALSLTPVYARSGVTLSKRLGAEAGSFPVTITFADDGDVTGLEADEIVVTNGEVASLVPSSSTETKVYTATINPTRSGTVTVRVPANAAQDAGGLGNLASNTLSVSVDLDARVKLVVSPDRISESAGPTDVTVTAEVQGTPFPDERTVQITISGASGRFSAQPGTFNLTIAANSSSGTGRFTLIPTANTADDGNANVSITGSITGGDRVIAATLRILDDDGRDDDDDTGGGGGGGGGGADRIRLSVTPVTVAENAGPTQVRVTAHVEDDDGDATSYDRDVTVTVKVAASPATGAVGFEPIADFEIEIGEGNERGHKAHNPDSDRR